MGPDTLRAREHLGRQIKRAANTGNIGPALALAGKADEVVIAAMLTFAEEQVADERERCARAAEAFDDPTRDWLRRSVWDEIKRDTARRIRENRHD